MYYAFLFRVRSWSVRLGDRNLANDEDDWNAIEREVEAANIHPRYENGFAYYDIAVLVSTQNRIRFLPEGSWTRGEGLGQGCTTQVTWRAN
jgi:hypothetical protein